MLTATDKGTIRIVVVAVAVLALALVGGVIVLAMLEKPIPSELGALATGSVTGLLGLLASTRSGAGGQEAVQAAQMAQAIQPLPAPGDPGGGLAILATGRSGANPYPTGLTTLADQGVDPTLGTSEGYPRNANADPHP